MPNLAKTRPSESLSFLPERAVSVLTALVFVATAVCVGHLLFLYAGMPAFRPDDMRYASSCLARLIHEGCWLTCLTFVPVSQVPPVLAGFVNLVCFFLFVYRCADALPDRRLALLVALASLVTPALHQMNEWPQTALISFVCLPLAALLARRLPIPIFFLTFGFVFGGGVRPMYFLLPLLFLNRPRQLGRVLFWWALSFVVCAVLANLYVHLMSGQFMEAVGAGDPDHALYGSRTSLPALQMALAGMFPVLAVPLVLAALFFLARLVRQRSRRDLAALIFLVLVGMSVFAVRLPWDLPVPQRLAMGLYLASLFLGCLAFARERLLLLVFLACFVGQYYHSDLDNLRYLTRIPQAWQAGLAKIAPEPARFRGVVLLSSQEEMQAHVDGLKEREGIGPVSTKSLASPEQWLPSAREHGFALVCLYGDRQDRAFLQAMLGDLDHAAVDFTRDGLYEYAVVQDFLVLRLL